ncbi:MAG TPA: acylphosphatase [Chitinophagaceae bacterium]|nr:acylphosphatase [Chitinophagaceae bacterium]
MAHTYSIKVKGRVQGVFYRQSAREKAEELGLTGVVKNEDDNGVGIIASGSKEQLDQLVKWCWQGPPRAEVDQVEIEEIPVQNFDDFRIIRR